MEPNDFDEHLSRIETRLSTWLKAHQGEGESTVVARQHLVLRYYPAVYRYLLGMLRKGGVADPQAEAEELTQEFALRILQGVFKGFNPERGRFRDYVKVAVRNLVMDYWRQKKHQKERAPHLLQPGQDEPMAAPAADIDFDRVFIEKWREELLARTWQALQKNQEETGQPYYTVLRLKSGQPDLLYASLADQASAQLGRPLTAENLRQLVHRSHRRFAELLVDEVARSIETTEPDQVAEELITLGLMSYCRSAVVERGPIEK